MERETCPRPSYARRCYAGLLRFCRHPASILVWFCLFSLTVQEQFPFSHYPMYSGWSDRTHYFYVRDSDGPIRAKRVFKVSVPRTKKLYGDIIRTVCKERGIDEGELSESDFQEAGRRLLENLRAAVPESRREKVAGTLDGELTLVRVDILHENGKFNMTQRDVVTTAADNKIR